MKVYELIEKLKKMPQLAEVKTDDGQYLDNPRNVELDDSRGYVIIRN